MSCSKEINGLGGLMEAESIVSLGNSIDMKQTRLWRQVEKDIFDGQPNYAPVVPNINLTDDTEFFIAYDREKAVGRAAASINREWIADKGDNLGFLNDFIIAPGYERLGGELIDRCLHVFQGKGIEGAVVRWSRFPALATEHLGEDVPPAGLACNPPWYVDLFEEKGFTRHREWVNYRVALPSRISEEGMAKRNRIAEALRADVGLLKWRNRQQVDQFLDLQEMILDGENSFGYSPGRELKKDAGLLSYLTYVLAAKLTRTSVGVVHDASGNTVACLSFAPNHNVALRPLRNRKRSWIRPSSWGTVAPAAYFVELRRTRLAQIKGFGFAPEIRGRSNLLVLVEYALNTMFAQGFREFDTGPIRSDNRPMMKVMEYIASKYGRTVRRTSYHTLLHRFQ
jgi:hypothetical protein